MHAHTHNSKKDCLVNKWSWGNWTATCKRMKLDHYLIPYTKINSKWSKDLNVRPKTIKLEKNREGKLLGIYLGEDSLDLTPKAKATRTEINK